MLLDSFVSNNLSNFGREHFKLFTNCHVSWDTSCIILSHTLERKKTKLLFYMYYI